jgi:hypothetical protein
MQQRAAGGVASRPIMLATLAGLVDDPPPAKKAGRQGSSVVSAAAPPPSQHAHAHAHAVPALGIFNELRATAISTVSGAAAEEDLPADLLRRLCARRAL